MQQIYRTVHEQGFIPIFTESGHNSKMLVEACVSAGCKVIEYTLRCRDAREMIPWIRQNYPDLLLLIGSTLDGDAIVKRARVNHAQLLTLDELVDIGASGFVSMLGFRSDTIRRLASTHLIIAPTSTMSEAHEALVAGAHFCKMIGPELDLVRLCATPPAFGVIPTMVTGGIHLDRIPVAIESGAVLVASGFDLMLKDQSPITSVQHVADILRRHLEVTRAARDRVLPELAQVRKSGDRIWFNSLPHHHPFEEFVSTESQSDSNELGVHIAG